MVTQYNPLAQLCCKMHIDVYLLDFAWSLAYFCSRKDCFLGKADYLTSIIFCTWYVDRSVRTALLFHRLRAVFALILWTKKLSLPQPTCAAGLAFSSAKSFLFGYFATCLVSSTFNCTLWIVCLWNHSLALYFNVCCFMFIMVHILCVNRHNISFIQEVLPAIPSMKLILASWLSHTDSSQRVGVRNSIVPNF